MLVALPALSAMGLACSDGGGSDPTGTGGNRGTPARAGSCVIEGEAPRSAGTVKDGIPALSNPSLVDPGAPAADYLEEEDRVMGLFWDGEWVALPLNVMRWHEIVNLTKGSVALAVTYCPLTGTGMAFDRGPVNGAEFGVTGLVWRNNLVMYDRSRDESFWPQMRSRADCGVSTGTVLPQLPVAEMTWAGWKRLHPDTRVVSSETGWDRDYTENPYDGYEKIDAPPLFEANGDGRRPPKERVLGIPDGHGGGVAIPFGVLASRSRAAVHLPLPDGAGGSRGSMVIFWDRDTESAEAFLATPDWVTDPGSQDPPRFEVQDGVIVDSLTGSVWTVDGRAVEGPATGSRLREVPESLVAFWFAWVSFNPGTDLVTSLE